MMSSNHLLNSDAAGDAGRNLEKTFVVVHPQVRAPLPPKPVALPKAHGTLIPKSYFVIALVVLALMSGVVGCLLTIQDINNHLNLEASHRQTKHVLQSPNDLRDKINTSGLEAKTAASGQSSTDENSDEVALPPVGSPVVEDDDSDSLRQAFRSWLEATNKCDINKQMSFYTSKVNAFYLARGLSQKAIRAEKMRVFGGARLININADEPAIIINPERSEAVMRFRKSYNIEGNIIRRNGEVLQELRWQRVKNNWLIVSERDLLVMR